MNRSYKGFNKLERQDRGAGLVLSRFPDERIYIIHRGQENSPIEITLVDVDGKKVRIGIRAGKEEYQILREEVVRNAGEEYWPILLCLKEGRPLTQSMIKKLDDLKH